MDETRETADAALAALAAGEGGRARRLAEVVLAADPGEPDALLVLATLALAAGDEGQATDLCRQVRCQGAENGWLLALEGRLALLARQPEVAAHKARKAAVAGAPDAHVASEIGVLLTRVGLHRPALNYFRFAAGDQPGRADYHYNYATAMQANGDLAGARAHFQLAVERDPALFEAWLGLARLEDNPPAEWVALLANAFVAATDPEKRLVLGHALSRMTEAQGDWNASLRWLERGKEGWSARLGYSNERTERAFAAAREAVSVPSAPNVAQQDRVLFVAGLPRSGTTLVQRILDLHPGLVSLGELPTWNTVLHNGLDWPGNALVDEGLISRATATTDLSDVGRDYLSRTRHGEHGGRITIDKTPLNILHAPAILRALPGAQVICLRRSPFDVLFGIYRQLFSLEVADYHFSSSLADVAHFVAGFEQSVDHFAGHLSSGRFATVRYEDLVADLEGEARRLIDFVGLEWDPVCVDFHANPRPTATASSAQVRKPLYKGAIERWRRYDEGAARAIDLLGSYGIMPTKR